MNTKDLTRQNGESSSTLGRYTGPTEQYPSVPGIYREMSRWMQDWDNLLGDFFGQRSGWLTRPNATIARLSDHPRFNPAIDIRESDDGYTVTAELPGIDPQDVDITVQEGSLLVSGEKKFEQESKGEGYHRMERSYGSFRRAIPLPKGVDLDHVDATFNNGLLTLTIPKLPEQKPQARKIEIKSATQQAHPDKQEPVETGTSKK
jgi:HSP20 family protein